MVALDALTQLYRSGTLAARYPDVPAMLAELTTDELSRAGRLLARLDVGQVRRAHPELPSTSVAITGHGTLAPLVPALTVQLARHGVLLDASIGDFDGYVADLADPASALRAAGPDLTVCVLDPAMVFDEVPVPWGPEEVAEALDGKLALIERLAAGYASTGALVVNTVPLPARFTAQLVDHRSRARLGVVWRAAMTRLLTLGEQYPGTVVFDLDPLVAEGVPVEDPVTDVYAAMHLSTALLERYARELGHLARHTVGRTKKCLVVDLDETLWGGTLGELGPAGIEAAGGRRGAAFQRFQRTVKQLASQGVLLAAVSKNDLEPVRQVLADHPDMTLRERDFVRVVANWRPKPDNLAELACDLNLGLDSLVFVDDSRYECGLVRAELPEVAVIGLEEEPALHASLLLADGWFEAQEVTEDDRARPARYREDVARKDFLDTFDTLRDYLRELHITVQVGRAAPQDLPRVAQLSRRTNQFNLTTERLSAEDVERRTRSADSPVLTVRAGDRFGDNGLVGAVFLTRCRDILRIDNFLLSCRVFARGIEQACLSAVLGYARDSGAVEVRGHYRPSARNDKVADFYPRYGFVPAPGSAGEFRHDLVAPMEPPSHIRMTVTI